MVKTPWGALPVADAHVHFFSHHFFSAIAADAQLTIEAVGSALGWQISREGPATLAELWIRELDRYGVERAVLIASTPGDHGSVIEAVRLHPQRLHAYVMVNPLAPAALDQASAALEGGYVRGLCFFPAMHRYSMHDERVAALLQLLSARASSVAFVHCGVLTLGFRKKLRLPSHFDMRFSNPMDLHAVALQYPTLKFVVPHFGAGYFREALMLCDLCPNVFLDTSSTNSWTRYQEASLDLRDVFRRALDVAGPPRLLFGTDSSFFPRGWNAQIFEAQVTALYEIGLDAETARLILHDNLVSLVA